MFEEIESDEKEILVTVLRVLEDIMCEPMSSFKITDHLIHDLHIDTDDLTELILEAEKNLNITVPRAKWSTVGTIRQLVEMLRRYR